MSKQHNEVKETQSLVDDIQKFGIDKLDDGDLDLINKFISALKPYLETVDNTISNLASTSKNNLSDTYEDELKFYQYKSKELHRLIPELEYYAEILKQDLIRREEHECERTLQHI